MFSSFNPSGAAILGGLMATVMLGFGIGVGTIAASCSYRSSLDCRREGSVVVCELRKLYPGAVASTDRFQLNTAVVEVRSYVLLRGGSRSYRLLILNSELEVPSAVHDPEDLAARLNELLDGKATVSGTIPLKMPSYGIAAMLSVLAVLLSGAGALLMWIVFRAGSSSPAA